MKHTTEDPKAVERVAGARKSQKTDVFEAEMYEFPSRYYRSFRRNFLELRAKISLSRAREDLRAISRAPTTGSLGSKAPIICFKVESGTDFYQRGKDISESVFRGVSVLLEPRSA